MEAVLEAYEEGVLANMSQAADWSSSMERTADQWI